MESYLADHTWTPRRLARTAGVALLAAVGLFVLLCCLTAAMFEVDGTGRPPGAGADPAFLALVVIVAAVAIAVPVLVGRRALRRPPHIYTPRRPTTLRTNL